MEAAKAQKLDCRAIGKNNVLPVVIIIIIGYRNYHGEPV
jgi:hypothetical protein